MRVAPASALVVSVLERGEGFRMEKASAMFFPGDTVRYPWDGGQVALSDTTPAPTRMRPPGSQGRDVVPRRDCMGWAKSGAQGVRRVPFVVLSRTFLVGETNPQCGVRRIQIADPFRVSNVVSRQAGAFR